jgi:hypothetical protein
MEASKEQDLAADRVDRPVREKEMVGSGSYRLRLEARTSIRYEAITTTESV